MGRILLIVKKNNCETSLLEVASRFILQRNFSSNPTTNILGKHPTSCSNQIFQATIEKTHKVRLNIVRPPALVARCVKQLFHGKQTLRSCLKDIFISCHTISKQR